MTSRDGRRLLERVLEHLNYERAICRDGRDRLALIEASFTCAEIIRNWACRVKAVRPAAARSVPAGEGRNQSALVTNSRKAAA